MKNFKLLKKQKGFALLEVMLAVIVILAAGVGVTKLYLSTKANSDLQKTEDLAQQVASAANQILSTSNDTNDVVTTAIVANSGLVSAGSVSNDEIISPFGTIEVENHEGGNHQEFTVTVNGLPQDQAMTLCRDMFQSFAVMVGTDGATLVDSVSDCSKTNIASATGNSVVLGYPKAAYSAGE